MTKKPSGGLRHGITIYERNSGDPPGKDGIAMKLVVAFQGESVPYGEDQNWSELHGCIRIPTGMMM